MLTLLSGLCDSQGFVHAAKIWSTDSASLGELGLSAAGFAGGIALFWITLRFAREVGIVSPETQTLGWFAATMLGVAIASRQILQWGVANQILAAGVALGLALLLYRTGS
jgi:hypothetical protein